ncbi:MAG: hypothetical protein R2854_00030 [Caldilineaceae bacterium]
MQAAAAPLLWLQQIGMLAAGLGLLGYHHHVLQTDGDYGQARPARPLLASALPGLGGTGRRGHVDAGNGGRGVLLDFGLERLAPGVGVTWAVRWRGLATLLTGALLTHWAGRQWQTVIALNPDGATSAWRRLYLYGAVVIGAVAR